MSEVGEGHDGADGACLTTPSVARLDRVDGQRTLDRGRRVESSRFKNTFLRVEMRPRRGNHGGRGGERCTQLFGEEGFCCRTKIRRGSRSAGVLLLMSKRVGRRRLNKKNKLT